jgi:hypothetical protein
MSVAPLCISMNLSKAQTPQISDVCARVCVRACVCMRACALFTMYHPQTCHIPEVYRDMLTHRGSHVPHYTQRSTCVTHRHYSETAILILIMEMCTLGHSQEHMCPAQTPNMSKHKQDQMIYIYIYIYIYYV